jgi:gluconate 2-dehydrogenase gamma chain
MASEKSSNAINRRKLLVLGASAVGTAAAGSVIAADEFPRHDGVLGAPGETISNELPWREGQADAPGTVGGEGPQYLTPAELEFVTAAADRLIPADATGPSASEAGVPTFIDRQLAGSYGQGQHFYLGGPWAEGTDTQGYQSRFTPAQLYRHAIAEIEAFVTSANGGKAYKDLSSDEQDMLLKQMDSGAMKLNGAVKASAFFTMFLQNVKEGYFSDPIYGGNKNGSAWAMIGFPGAHYDYSPWVTRYNEPVPVKPVGLRGRADWSRS